MNKHLFIPADILLPKKDFEKWSVIACDQFTSRLDYWEDAAEFVGDAPSTLKLIYPEVYLGKTDKNEVTKKINSEMIKYLENGVYNEYKNAFIYVERIQSDGKMRAGLVGAVDLNQYDYREDSSSKVRATEKTVLERIPPRVEIRKGAVTELPHVLMLMDDVCNTVIEPLGELAKEGKLTKLYDFTLMLGGGSIKGYLVPAELNEAISQKIEALGERHSGITLAVGDGNHSLASAKDCYELDPENVSSYALCELVNIHTPALEFEPIYRTVENCDPASLFSDFKQYLADCGAEIADSAASDGQRIRFVFGNREKEIFIKNPPHTLAVGTVQLFLDSYLKNGGAGEVDYIHGEDEVNNIASKPGACGFIYDGMSKSELFTAVEKEGVLPRKTFSMGHARDKRYYTEVRKIRSI